MVTIKQMEKAATKWIEDPNDIEMPKIKFSS